MLSPYLRTGLLSQPEVLRAVLRHHGRTDANKFISEVFWRSYWQGWLALRPPAWYAYLSEVKHLFNQVQTQSGLRHRWADACQGRTGIAPFDAWATELASNGYLHNHARMWFASIWIHTLRLPWQLGADFFLRHLLDGCPASNTLSWKWVAGLQTIGKPYLATAENIATFTNGRYSDVPDLASTAADIPAPPHPDPCPLWKAGSVQSGLRTGLILHEDNVSPAHILDAVPDIASHAVLLATDRQTPWQMAPQVLRFRRSALADAQNRHTDMIGAAGADIHDAQSLAAWAEGENLAQIVTTDAPVGPTKSVLDGYDQLSGTPPLIRLRAPLDAAAWPLATKGFFKFRDHIPGLLDGLD